MQTLGREENLCGVALTVVPDRTLVPGSDGIPMLVDAERGARISGKLYASESMFARLLEDVANFPSQAEMQ